MNGRVITNVVDGVVISCMLAGDSGRKKCAGMIFFLTGRCVVVCGLEGS